MPSRPTILLILSFPVGAIAYTVGARVVASIWPGEGFLILILPLFLAGIAMLPFLVPWFDRKAKQDLAEYRRSQASAEEGSGDEPGDGQADGTPPESR